MWSIVMMGLFVVWYGVVGGFYFVGRNDGNYIFIEFVGVDFGYEINL